MVVGWGGVWVRISEPWDKSHGRLLKSREKRKCAEPGWIYKFAGVGKSLTRNNDLQHHPIPLLPAAYLARGKKAALRPPVMRCDLDHLPAAKRRELERAVAIILAEFDDAVKLARMGADRARLLEDGAIARFIHWVANKPPDFHASTR